ncbi:hypothetical protein ACFIQF_11545 [Comamonas sp. J-3]|uniref:hypothetical protein n=1 Tax=Comamonas trifloxystrobinivorans TaxID=3350256 RepID=UPI00372C8A67
METTLSTNKLLDALGNHVAMESGTFSGGTRADVWVTSSVHYHNQKWGGDVLLCIEASHMETRLRFGKEDAEALRDLLTNALARLESAAKARAAAAKKGGAA